MNLKKAALAGVAEAMKKGGVAVIPTDTVYGIVGPAFSRSAVARIYKLRRRDPNKPMIVLIGDIADLARFGIRPTPNLMKILKAVWPGRVSVVLKIVGGADQDIVKKLSYLHRETGTIAFRLPRPLWLRRLLVETGPLVAPSANHQGKPAAQSVPEARSYFGNDVDCYVDAGILAGSASTLIDATKRPFVLLRKGSGKLPPEIFGKNLKISPGVKTY